MSVITVCSLTEGEDGSSGAAHGQRGCSRCSTIGGGDV